MLNIWGLSDFVTVLDDSSMIPWCFSTKMNRSRWNSIQTKIIKKLLKERCVIICRWRLAIRKIANRCMWNDGKLLRLRKRLSWFMTTINRSADFLVPSRLILCKYQNSFSICDDSEEIFITFFTSNRAEGFSANTFEVKLQTYARKSSSCQHCVHALFNAINFLD